MQWHQLDHKQTICTSLQTDNHINTSSLNFYRLDALPDAEPTVSKHCNLLITTIIITIMYKFLLPLVSDGLTNKRQRVSESWLKNVCTSAHIRMHIHMQTRIMQRVPAVCSAHTDNLRRQEFCCQWTSRVEQFTCGTAIKWRHGGDFQKTAEDTSVQLSW